MSFWTTIDQKLNIMSFHAAIVAEHCSQYSQVPMLNMLQQINPAQNMEIIK